MITIEKEKLTSIKSKLREKPISSLDYSEFFVYFAYRLKELVSKHVLLSRLEIKYLMCEVGNGKLRFDPEIVDILLETNSHEESVRKRRFGKHEFIIKAVYPEEELRRIAYSKVKLLNIMESLETREKTLGDLGKLIADSSSLIGYPISELHVNHDEDAIEFISTNKMLFIVYYPNKWVYPYSVELWRLIRKSSLEDLNPVIVARKAHGICYPMFKAMNIFGANTYSCYLPEDVARKIMRFNASYADTKITYKPGKISLVVNDEQIEKFISGSLIKYNPSKKLKLPNELIELLASSEAQTQERLNALAEIVNYLPSAKTKKHLLSWINFRAELFREIGNQ